MFIWTFDISLSNTGVCIFDEHENPVKLFSIATTSKKECRERLKTIGDILLEVKKDYPTDLIVLESGFSRFNVSTQTLFRVHGVVNYLFADCTQIYYAPSTIKKIVGGNGRMDKQEIKKIVRKRYPELNIENEDQSDAVSVGLCYFKLGK
jgi:Holliday junction resolvasome RuvABC endonuclease subunit